MNRLLHWLSLVAIAISFVACNNEEVDVPRFQYDANGRCYLPNVKQISYAEFLQYAEGNGWNHVSTYEINPDGSVQETDYYEGLEGSSPSDFYFMQDHYSYRYFTCEFGEAFSTHDYQYKVGNLIGYHTMDGTFYTKFQVLSINENELQVVKHLAYRAGENARDIYGLVTFSKMTDEELESYRRAYESYIGQLPPVE